ncbi:speckle-type POZ protein-like [Diachasma alloeum]|uniref:speckle-type POZ protein-like n=1 Tax=Diachasma alloeum TaxID=454923 RepID=UPI00073850A1|nr:speckle-type POZ protein-like [Diachasma alloeum]
MNPLQLSDFAMSTCLSDVTIVIGDEKIPCHKLVLGAASPVLLSMLTSEMEEAAENSIVIEDIEVVTMKAVLNYLYKGEDEDFDGFEMALKALVVSEKYAMEKFKALIEEKLIKCLTIDNATNILDQADTYQAKRLVQKCMEFIVHRRNEIMIAKVFKELCDKKPGLMMQFIVGIINVTKELRAQLDKNVHIFTEMSLLLKLIENEINKR